MAFRWIDLLYALTPASRPPFLTVLRIFFLSTFVGTFLPSVGGDIYRAYSLARHEVPLAESAASVLMDRMLGVFSIALVGTLALIPTRDAELHRGIAFVLIAAAATCAVAAVVVFSERAATVVWRLTARVSPGRLHRAVVALTDAVHRYSGHQAELLRVLVVSVLVQVIRIVQAWCLGRALGLELPLVMYFALIPLVLLVMLLPITVNGIGTSQWAFDRLFVPAGASPAQAFAVSVLFVALGLVGNLPGGILYAVGPPASVRERRAR